MLSETTQTQNTPCALVRMLLLMLGTLFLIFLAFVLDVSACYHQLYILILNVFLIIFNQSFVHKVAIIEMCLTFLIITFLSCFFSHFI